MSAGGGDIWGLNNHGQSLFFLIVRREWREKIRTRESWRLRALSTDYKKE